MGGGGNEVLSKTIQENKCYWHCYCSKYSKRGKNEASSRFDLCFLILVDEDLIAQ